MKPYVYAVFLRLPCESIPPRQRFHLADKVITAREFNAHVRLACTKKSGGARTVRGYYSDDDICVTCTVRVPCVQSEGYVHLYPTTFDFLRHELNDIQY